MNVVVNQKPEDVSSRLAALNLQEEWLKEAVRRGQLAFLSCTPNHPPNFAGLAAWAETVCAVREILTPAGWERTNDNNYPLCVDAKDQVAIAVATADGGTGRVEATPSTNSRKGSRTVDAVAANQLRFAFMDEPIRRRPGTAPDGAGRETWYLLIHHAEGEARCELSLPISMTDDGHIVAWRERILLESIPLDGALAETVPEPPALPDIDVSVRRRA